MLRSPIGLGLFIGAILGFAFGFRSGLGQPGGSGAMGLVWGMFLGACGLIAGAMAGAAYNLAVRLTATDRVPTDGPEADYHDLPPRS